MSLLDKKDFGYIVFLACIIGAVDQINACSCAVSTVTFTIPYRLSAQGNGFEDESSGTVGNLYLCIVHQSANGYLPGIFRAYRIGKNLDIAMCEGSLGSSAAVGGYSFICTQKYLTGLAIYCNAENDVGKQRAVVFVKE